MVVQEAVEKIDQDVKKALINLPDKEIRFLVDTYYQMQEKRKRTSNQIKSMEEEPHSVLDWLNDQNLTMENEIRKALDAWTKNHPVGKWMRTIKGVGPITTAGILAYVDIEQAPTVGHIWRMAGLDPTVKWLNDERTKSELAKIGIYGTDDIFEADVLKAARHFGRGEEGFLERMRERGFSYHQLVLELKRIPWNKKFKTLLWNLGESFVKTKSREGSYYGPLYDKRREYEDAKNEAGDYAPQAERTLKNKNYSKNTDAYRHYSEGKLPPAHIHARCKRWVVKLFLAHVHEVMYEEHHGRPAPLPYPIAFGEHEHVIPAPNKN